MSRNSTSKKKAIHKAFVDASNEKFDAAVRAAAKEARIRAKYIPDGHEVVSSAWLQGLINERDAYMKACERAAGQELDKTAITAKGVGPQDAQNQIVSILTNFQPNLQNIILSCTLTLLKGYRTAAVDRANDRINELNHQALEAENYLKDAVTCKAGFDELVTAAAKELH